MILNFCSLYLVSNQAINNQDITIYGNGDQTRSFCSIDGVLIEKPFKLNSGWFIFFLNYYRVDELI